MPASPIARSQRNRPSRRNRTESSVHTLEFGKRNHAGDCLMTDAGAALAAFPITRKWPAQHPDRIQLYSLPTPNGLKASIMLEETGLPYEPHLVDFAKDDQKSPE